MHFNSAKGKQLCINRSFSTRNAKQKKKDPILTQFLFYFPRISVSKRIWGFFLGNNDICSQITSAKKEYIFSCVHMCDYGWLVSRITQKLQKGFPWILNGEWVSVQNRPQ